MENEKKKKENIKEKILHKNIKGYQVSVGAINVPL